MGIFPCLFSDGICMQGAEVSYTEMLGTFLLEVGAMVCASSLHELSVLDLDLLILIRPEMCLYRLEWNIGLIGLTKLPGLHHCGICMRYNYCL